MSLLILNVIDNKPRQDILDQLTAATILLQGIRFSLVSPRASSNFNPAKHKLARNIGRVTGDLCLLFIKSDQCWNFSSAIVLHSSVCVRCVVISKVGN